MKIEFCNMNRLTLVDDNDFRIDIFCERRDADDTGLKRDRVCIEWGGVCRELMSWGKPTEPELFASFKVWDMGPNHFTLDVCSAGKDSMLIRWDGKVLTADRQVLFDVGNEPS